MEKYSRETYDDLVDQKSAVDEELGLLHDMNVVSEELDQKLNRAKHLRSTVAKRLDKISKMVE